jgi:hypothetical protein
MEHCGSGGIDRPMPVVGHIGGALILAWQGKNRNEKM